MLVRGEAAPFQFPPVSFLLRTRLRSLLHPDHQNRTRALLVGPNELDSSSSCLQVPVFKPADLMVEASPRRVFANAHTYHVNSISVNSDGETYLSTDDLRINLWNLEITDCSFSILVGGLVAVLLINERFR